MSSNNGFYLQTVPGTYTTTAPAGTNLVLVTLVGGGGGGGNAATNIGAGGGAASVLKFQIYVNNGAQNGTFQLVVGAGGTGATGSTPPGVGGDTMFALFTGATDASVQDSITAGGGQIGNTSFNGSNGGNGGMCNISDLDNFTLSGGSGAFNGYGNAEWGYKRDSAIGGGGGCAADPVNTTPGRCMAYALGPDNFGAGGCSSMGYGGAGSSTGAGSTGAGFGGGGGYGSTSGGNGSNGLVYLEWITTSV